MIERPYEERCGATEAVYEESLADLCATLERSPLEPGVQLLSLRDSLVRGRNRFRALSPRRKRTLPLIGIVGEIFCRLNTFSNEDLVRWLEAYGAEAWVSDLVEWIWYTNSEHFRKLKLTGRIWTAEALGAWVRKRVQKRDEHVLLAPFDDDFAGREEPDIYEILEAARPYLPREGAFRRNGAERRKGGLPGQERRRRNHRYQPIYLYEWHCLRGDLSSYQPRPRRHPHP